MKTVEYIEKHREIWNWLVKNPGKGKDAYFMEKGIGYENIPLNGCWACEWAKMVSGEAFYPGFACQMCLFEWPTVEDREEQVWCNEARSIYKEWSYSVRTIKMLKEDLEQEAKKKDGGSERKKERIWESLFMEIEECRRIARAIRDLPLSELAEKKIREEEDGE